MESKEQISELKGLRVTVDRVAHNADFEGPKDKPYCFAYFITIHNESDRQVTIKGRKWVVTNADGDVTAVEGSGVVGQSPQLAPGDSFSYNSFHLLETRTGSAEGSYLGVDADGHKVRSRIPRFEMEAPL